MFFEGNSFRKSLAESERNERFQRGKILETIEHIKHSIRYCKISLHMYSWSSRQLNAGTSLTYPVQRRPSKTTISLKIFPSALDQI